MDIDSLIDLANGGVEAWKRFADKQDSGTLIQNSRSLDIQAEQCVRAAEYLDQRSHGADHEKAMKAVNKRGQKMRKAIGYNG